MHITSGCKILASREYMAWHNDLLKFLMVAWCKEHELTKRYWAWYKFKWVQGAVLENEHVTISWDFEYNMRKESTARSRALSVKIFLQVHFYWEN